MKQKKKISQQELNLAVKKFVKEGGIIKKLPPQRSALQNLVGGKWGNTEIGGKLGQQP